MIRQCRQRNNHNDKTSVRFALTNATPYHALTDDIWGIFRELYKEKLPPIYRERTILLLVMGILHMRKTSYSTHFSREYQPTSLIATPFKLWTSSGLFSYICHNFSNIFEMEIPVKVIYKNSTGKSPRLSGTLYIERSGPEGAPSVTEVTPEDYDSTGAVKYMIAVLVVYSLSAFLLMASRTRRQRERLALYREVQHFFKKKPTYARQSRMEEVQKCRASLVDTEGVFVHDISSGGLPLHHVAKRKHINPICNYLCGLVADEKRTSQHMMVDEVAGVHGPSSSSHYYQSASVAVDDMAGETPEVYDSIDRNDRKKCHCKCKQEEYNMEKMQARRALTPSLCGAQNDRGEVWQLQWYKKIHKLPNLNKTNLQNISCTTLYTYIYTLINYVCRCHPQAHLWLYFALLSSQFPWHRIVEECP